MPSLLDQYLPLAVFMAVAAAISGALLLAPFLAAFKAPDPEKLSAYEGGFNAFDDARMQFEPAKSIARSRRRKESSASISSRMAPISHIAARSGLRASRTLPRWIFSAANRCLPT